MAICPPPDLEELPDVRPGDRPLYVTLFVLRPTEKARLQTALEREVDSIVFRTYKLSPEKVEEIERWHRAARSAGPGQARQRRRRGGIGR